MLDLSPTGGASDGPSIAFIDLAPGPQGFRAAALEGLSQPAKSIPCRFLYDAAGSALFDRICELEEYYPTRAETEILTDRAAEIARRVGPDAELIELGSGSSIKVRILLDALQRPSAYVAVDISAEHLRAAAEALAADYPQVKVAAVCADYARPFRLPRLHGAGRRVGFFPGSTIGNLTPEEAEEFLAAWADRLGPGAAMIVGVDLKKDAAILNLAYDDPKGVTAAFSLNLLARANRELGADFDLDAFAHDARYDPDKGRVEIHIQSLVLQSVRVAGRTFPFEAGERIHTEYSYKYALDEFADLARRSGFQPETAWTDSRGLFSVHLLTTPAG